MKRATKIGVVGTAKNTGKTTTLLTIYEFLNLNKKKIIITGIGYDGEEIDNITFLPKPRIKVNSGTIVATSERLLTHFNIPFTLIEKSNIENSLGMIVFAEINDESMVTVAGPTTLSGLKKIFMSNVVEQVDYVLVDGSINRLSPLAIVDYLIFTTGFSRSENLEQLAYEIKVIEDCFNLGIAFHSLDKNVPVIRNLISGDKIKNMAFNLSKIDMIKIEGVINGKVFIELLKSYGENKLIILDSPLTMIYSFTLNEILDLFSLVNKEKIHIAFENKPELLCITINPSFPMFNGATYRLELKSSDTLKEKISERVNLPIFDVVKKRDYFFSFLSQKFD